MIRVAILATMALASVPVAAQEAPTELWGGIRVGMTLDEAVTAQPKYTTRLTDDCKVNREIIFPDGDRKKGVVGVKLYASLAPSGEHCLALVRDGLRTKYGEPIDTKTEQASIGRSATRQTYTFANASVRVTFKSSTGDSLAPDQWEAVYEPVGNVANMAAKL